MRKVFLIGLSALMASVVSSANGQQRIVEPAPTISCVTFPSQLQYPAAALDANIMGVVTAAFAIDEDGQIHFGEGKGHFVLLSGVVEALRSAHVNAECRGRTIAMRLDFRLDQDLPPNSPVVVKAISGDQFEIDGPARYEIVAPARTIEVTIVDPARMFSRKGRVLHHLNRWARKLRFW